MPDSTRFTIMLFPPYGLAWLWLHKGIDQQRKVAGSIGMSLYLGLWICLVGFVLYFFTPLGVGDQIWSAGAGDYDRNQMMETLKRKQQLRELEKQNAPGSPQARMAPIHVHLASSGRHTWSVG